MREFDFVVIGSGIAGLSFALKVAEHGSVAVDYQAPSPGFEHRMGRRAESPAS